MQFFDKFTANKTLKAIETGKLKCFRADGSELKIKPRKTKFQRVRNYSLTRAMEIIESKVSSRKPKPQVEIDWKLPDRKIKVDNEDAFLQKRDDYRGTFVGKFCDTAFSDR